MLVMRSKMSSGSRGICGEGYAGGVFDGVEDGGGGAVHGEFADAFGSEGAVDAGDLFEVDVEWAGGRRWWA